MAPARRPALLAATLVLAASRAAAFPERLELDLGAGQHLSLVLVRGGTFQQGSAPGERGRGPDEAPRPVTVTRDFYLGEVPVLRSQFAHFAEATGYRTEAETGRSGGYGFDGRALVQRPGFTWRSPGFAQTDEHPAVILTFDDASRFAAWASGQTGRAVRLPTEAEWELACRAGTTTPYYNGADDAAAQAAGWFRVGSGTGTRPVRARAPNALGLHDMVGHVQQWAADWYAPYPPGAATDPLQLTAGSPPGEPARRVLRGGSWLRGTSSGRCAARSRSTPGSRNADTGFRVAMDASEGLAEVAAVPPASTPPPAAPPPELNAPPPDTSSDVWGVFALVGGLFATGAGLVAALVLRGRRSAGAAPDRRAKGGAVGARQVRVVPAADGFRVFAPGHLAGGRAYIEFRQGGNQRAKWVVLERSAQAGQFVYTGATPEALVVLAVEAASGHGASHGDDRGHFGGHDDHGHFGGHDDHGSSHDEPAPMPTYQGPPSAY